MKKISPKTFIPWNLDSSGPCFPQFNELLLKDAEQGIAPAQYQLGAVCHQGKGVPQDYTEAVKWFRKSAEQGYAGAQFQLGAMYGKGQGVPQNYIEAYVWSSLAASTGGENAVQNRDLAATKLTPEDLAAAQKKAAKLFEEINARKAKQD
jgi:TPR repeat protein